MTDSREVFSGKEFVYENSRPGYPAQAIDFLYGELGFTVKSVIADYSPQIIHSHRQTLKILANN